MGSRLKNRDKSKVKRVKTGAFERRLSLAGMSIVSGTRAASGTMTSMFKPKAQRQARHKEIMAKEAQYIADELGKLKGSVVKVGQIMALYGDHILPEEVTTALRTLEENTTALEWETLEPHVKANLGEARFDQLKIDPEPIGCASLAQVHKAVILETGEQICLKIQYPGVAESIDSDLSAVAMLLKLTKAVSSSADFDDWLEEVREMLTDEIDYLSEAEKTQQFSDFLSDDDRYVVPTIYPEYCTDKILAASFEEGYSVSDAVVQALPQSERNALAESFLDLFFNEVYKWQTLQTDPNFGNYRIQYDDAVECYRIVLLDFGAVKAYDSSFIDPLKDMIKGALLRDTELTVKGAIDLKIMPEDLPSGILASFADVCFSIIEPLNFDANQLDSAMLNEQGEYIWADANLPKRVAKQATKAAFSEFFALPPKEFTFISRKLLGVFSFISALKAEFNGKAIALKYID